MMKMGILSAAQMVGFLRKCRESRRLVLVLVAIALLLDNMLLTTVVPIIPEFLYEISHEAEEEGRLQNGTLNELVQRPLEEEAQLPDGGVTIPSNLTTTPPFGRGSDYNDDRKYDPWRQHFRCYGAFCRQLPPDEGGGGSGTGRISSTTDFHRRHEELTKENLGVGLMFASKAVVQIITNPFIGLLTNRIGYSIPMFTGFVIIFISTLGMGMLAEVYPDDKERGNAMGIALGGLALGVLVGPPFGGVMYQYVGKSAPFLILATLTFLNGRAITIGNMGIGVLEPSLPIFMMDTMNAVRWQLGAAFLPASISYLLTTNIFGPLGHRIGRWLCSLLGLIMVGLSLSFIPSAKSFKDLIPPNFCLGFAIGMVDSSMLPHLGYLVDVRHSHAYGGVYAIGDMAFCLGFTIGPALSGSMVRALGFAGMLYAVATINFLYAPLMLLIRKPPTREENQVHFKAT